MSSEEFEKLHEIYRSLYDELKLIPEKALSCTGETSLTSSSGVMPCVHVCLQLQGMEEELRSAPASYRNAMSTKLRFYRRDLGKLQREMKISAPGSGSSSHTVQGGHHGIYSSQNQQSTNLQSQRALLLQGTEYLNSASQSIEQSHRLAAESERIGTDIIEELGEQREQLDRARDRLVNTGENLSKSRKILRSISRKLMTNKLLLAVIILMESAILGAVIYLKFFRH
uniref:Vesicle transport through interaction with t-SNAREs 1B n=1 Tax=Nothobranchius furzeri TaxID=105023 RepID=A0A8C6L0G8_NOTFU